MRAAVSCGRVRILVVNAVPFVGGAERWIAHLASRLVPRGHEIEVAHRPGTGLDELLRRTGARPWNT